MNDADQHPLIQQAIRWKGSQEALAAACGVEQQTISRLLNRRRRVTAEMAIAIDRATRGTVSKHALRPDLFEAPAVGDAEAAA